MSSLHERQNDTVLFGFFVYLMSDVVLFAGLFAAYAVLRGEVFGGFGPAQLTDLPYVLTETLLLLTSSFTAGLALLSAQKKNLKLTSLALIITLLLGWGFLGMEAHEFIKLIGEGHGPAQTAFLSAFFALVGTHGLHVAVGSLWMLILFAHLYIQGLTDASLRKLTLLTLFWHFLDIVWIFIFTFVYLFGTL